MGSFDSTCGITRLPIHYADPIVYVKIEDEFENRITTQGLIRVVNKIVNPDKEQMFHSAEISCNILRKILVQKGESPITDEEHQKNIVNSVRLDIKRLEDKVTIFHGYYNDYGGIAAVQYSHDAAYPIEEDRLSNMYFFMHQAVWDRFDIGQDKHNILFNIALEARRARIQITPANTISGEQYSGEEFVDARNKFLAIEEQILPNLYCMEGYDES